MKNSVVSLEPQVRNRLLKSIENRDETILLNRIHILLKSDEGKSSEEISQLLYIDEREVERTCELFELKGLETALYQPHEDVLQLRKAAHEYNWLVCERVCKQLFPLLKLKDIIYIFSFQLSIFLPLFELSHSDVEWPHQFLSQFRKSSSKERLYNFPFYRETYSSAGSNGFLEAMGFLANIDYSQNDPSKYMFTLAAEGVAKVIESRWLYYWAKDHSNEWEHWVRTNSKPAHLESAIADEAASNSWLTVADEVEKRL